MFYVGVIIALFLLRFALAGKTVFSKQVYFFVLFGLFLFSAFRFQVGCDWTGYYFQYLGAADQNWTAIVNRREIIWQVILGLFQNKGLPYPVVNIASSAIFFIGIHVLARRQPDPLGFLVLLFPILIINMPMSAIRQGAAIGLICIALAAFIDRRPFWYAFWVIVAVGFHFSALVFTLLLPLTTGRYTRNRLIVTALLSVPGVYALTTGDAVGNATEQYIKNWSEASGAIFRLGIIGLTSIYFFLCMKNKWNHTFPKDYALVSIGAIGMMLVFFLIPISSVVGDRFGYYLIPIQTIIFARLPFLPFHLNARLHSALPYILLLMVFAVWASISYHFHSCYIPYQSWLFGFPSRNLSGL